MSESWTDVEVKAPGRHHGVVGVRRRIPHELGVVGGLEAMTVLQGLGVRVGAQGLAQLLEAALTELRVQVVEDRQVEEGVASPQA